MKHFECIGLVPVFNRKDKLIDFFDNALKLDNFFWLVIDDNSTDGTKQFVEDLQKENPNIGYLNTNDGDLFWGGSLSFALERMSQIVQQYGLQDLKYYAFINDDIAFDPVEVANKFSTFDGKSIYSAVAFRNGKYLCGFDIGTSSNGHVLAEKPSADLKVDTIGGYLIFYPIDCIGQMSAFTLHHQADVSYCYETARKFDLDVYATPEIVAIVNDDDKGFMAKMSWSEYINGTKSPYEYRANIYYMLVCSKSLGMFCKLFASYIYRLVRSRIYYKLIYLRKK